MLNLCRSVVVSWLLCFSAIAIASEDTAADVLVQAYIDEWKSFYPSDALSNGLKSAAWHFEDFSSLRLESWIAFNRQTAASLQSFSSLGPQQEINTRVLLRQLRLEQERWQYDRVLEQQAIYYAELISQALTYILVREQFSPAEKLSAIKARLKGVIALCQLGEKKLINGSPQRTARAIKILERSAEFYRTQLPQLVMEWSAGQADEAMTTLVEDAATAVSRLARHISQAILPNTAIADVYKAEDYARKLKTYVDSDISPAQLRDSALAEINEVRRLMSREAQAWWQENIERGVLPAEETELLEAAMHAMESEREDNRADFLEFFTTLTGQAESFVIEKDLASVPLPRTLFIGLSPDHFSGAAYGGVYPTGPFAPDANTLFYLPTIPDDSPEQQKQGFYRSFNNHFNIMIIAHEMLPGHYMQYKVAVNKAPALRSLYANSVYVEGWGTFSEELMLNAGWGDGKRLTRLAHLRKRLENATRAYTSVMVHTENWNKTQLMEFASTRGLLAPQFATNLWNRVMNSPMQITSYFLGFHGFRALWQGEQERLGDKFNTRNFVDAVLDAGPIPIEALAETMQ